MSSSTVRTVVIFSIIALILGGAAIGGLRLMKARDASYASSQTQKTATTDTSKQPAVEKPKDGTKNTSPSNNAPTTQNKPSHQEPVTAQTPAPGQTNAPAPTPPSAPQPAANTTKPPTVASNALPATSGMTPSDFFATFALMLVAAFFGNKLLKARADYRRYLGLQ